MHTLFSNPASSSSSSNSDSLLPLPKRVPVQRTAPPQCASTRAAYARDVERFIRSFGGSLPCTPDTLIAYIVAASKRVAPSTLLRRCMAIQDAHAQMRAPSPTADPRIREAMRQMAKGQRPGSLAALNPDAKPKERQTQKSPRQAKPISRALLLRMLDAMGTGARSMDRRDKVILTLGFAGLKRGMICALHVEDLRFTEDAMLVRVRGPNAADGEEGGRHVAIPITRGPLCAATACRVWIEHNQMEGQSGPLVVRFTRSGEPTNQRLDAAYVNAVVKERLRAAGVADVEGYSAESLRRGRGRAA